MTFTCQFSSIVRTTILICTYCACICITCLECMCLCTRTSTHHTHGPNMPRVPHVETWAVPRHRCLPRALRRGSPPPCGSPESPPDPRAPCFELQACRLPDTPSAQGSEPAGERGPPSQLGEKPSRVGRRKWEQGPSPNRRADFRGPSLYPHIQEPSPSSHPLS